MSIKIEHLRKRFGTFSAVDDVTLDIREGELLALLGPSGSGKTTLLRVIAGLEQADGGRVLFDGEDATSLSVQARRAGFVFQHYALFRHLTVEENIAFGLRVRRGKQRVADAVIRARVAELLSLVQLDGLGGRYPAQLSGGQRQRVALARALAIQPQVLLLDEPFGALDAKVRQELRQWLRRLHDEIGMTTVFVTHDQEEAFEVSDEVVVMNKGRIEQLGTPRDVFEHPANPFVMDFLGHVNVFSGRVQNGKAHWGGVEVAYPAYPHGESREAAVYVRPHELDIERFERDGALRIEVKRVNPTGAVAKVYGVSVDFGSAVHVELPAERYAELDLQEGEFVYVAPRRVRVFLPEYSI